jgi:NAD(P)-dependent dehydrogenase (short-subunit alcohol dehydrogenase family)
MSRSGGVPRQSDMNEIVITGSTGGLGRRAVRELLAPGHRVTGVTRCERGRERLESLGAHVAALSRNYVREAIETSSTGGLGRVLPSGDGHRAALSFVVGGGRITRIDAFRNPEKLRRL